MNSTTIQIPDQGAQYLLQVLRQGLAQGFSNQNQVQLGLFQNPVLEICGPDGDTVNLGVQCSGGPVSEIYDIDITDNSLTMANIYEANYYGYSRFGLTDNSWQPVSSWTPYTTTYSAQTFYYNNGSQGSGQVDCNVIYGYFVVGYNQSVGQWNQLIWLAAFDKPILFNENGCYTIVVPSMCIDERPTCAPFDPCGPCGAQYPGAQFLVG